MDIRKLQRAIVDGLEDVKGHDIQVFNTEHLSALFERVIIASGTSNRQTKALAASVRDAVRAAGLTVLRTEGETSGEWIIVDCGAAVVHIMQPAIRQYYNLEEIWGGKLVKVKLADEVRKLVKASAPQDQEVGSESKAAAKKTAAKKTAATKAPAGGRAGATKATAHSPGRSAGKPAGKSAARPAAKSATKPSARPAAKPGAKPAAKKTAAPRSAAGKTTAKPAPRQAIKTVVAGKPAARKPAAKPAAKKTAARPARGKGRA